MGDVIAFQKPRRSTIRGAARSLLTDAMGGISKPIAVMIVVLGSDGKYSLRTANYTDAIHNFDMYSRGAAALQREASQLVE